MNILKNNIILLMLLIMLLSSVNVDISATSPTNSIVNSDKTILSISNSIYIDSNEDFKNFDFPGNGTLLDPYIISGYEFIDPNKDLITINYTNAYFIIENNILNINDSDYRDSDIYSGILFNDIENGIVRENKILSVGLAHSYSGIKVVNSSNIIIRENLFYTDDGSGSISNNFYFAGIRIGNSSQIEIIGNLINGHGGDGIIASGSNILVQANVIHSSAFSIGLLFYGNNSEIINNNFTKNKRFGLGFWGLQNGNNKISENNFINNGLSSNGNQISNYGDTNVFSNNYWSDFVSPDNNNDGIVDQPYEINTELTTGWVNITDDNPRVDPIEINIPTTTSLDAFIEKPLTASFDFLLFNLILVLLISSYVKKK